MRGLFGGSLRPAVAAGVLLALALSPGFGQRPLTPAGATSPIGFGATTVVDDQANSTEPDVKVCGPSSTWSYGTCGQNNPYASGPDGFSTTTSFAWRSEDQASTFKLVPSNNTTGKPDACPGGGDTDLAVSPGTSQGSDFLDFIDLQGLTNFSSGVSPNGGQSFTCSPVSSTATVVDRQWFGLYKPPQTSGSIVYLDYDLVAGATCATNPSAAGNAFVVQSSTNKGLTYSPPVVADCNDGIAGNMQVNQTNGHIFAIHTAYSTPSSPITADAVVVNKSTDHGATWSRSTVFQCLPAADCTTGQDFSVLAIDKSGGLYAVWSQAPVDSTGAITGPSHIFYSYSSNEGTSWTPEKQVDSGSTNVNIFPWIVAGKAGAIDVVWYATTKAASVSSYDSGKQISDWYPYMAQSLNANGTGASFSAPVAVSQHPNHNGGICTMGIGCVSGGDRSLGDFFQVDVNKQGGADVIFADTSNNGSNNSNQSALTDEARQVSGTTLFGTTLSGSAGTCSAITPTPCVSDRTGDARYEANGIIGQNVAQADITGTSLNLDPTNHSRLDARMNVLDLDDTGVNAMDPYLDYLISWNYHIPGDTQANYDSTGNVYYAYLEVNTATGTYTAYDGNTCSVATTHPKYLVYPGQHAITFKASNNTIDLYVPLTDVGNPGSGAKLYSVTAHTVGQSGPAGPYNCTTRDPNGNNQDPSGKIFNVYDKAAAYTAILNTGV